MAPKESLLRLERAGEGNMNLTLRVLTNKRSFILKQGRPWVEKYPNIPAPRNRTLVEGLFYQCYSESGPLNLKPSSELGRFLPRFLGLHSESHLLAMEDLGEAADYLFLYNLQRPSKAAPGTQTRPISEPGNQVDERLTPTDLKVLLSFLFELHREEIDLVVSPHLKPFLNPEMRKLNHEHIFLLPFREKNGLNLDSLNPGLNRIAQQVKGNHLLKREINHLGDLYLEERFKGPLLHGDFYPGSWLKTSQGLKIIDPEFCFIGPVEYDLGVFLAHLVLSHHPKELWRFIFEHYAIKPTLWSPTLCWQFAGVEILRRLLGVAQLPLNYSLEEKMALVQLAQKFILSPDHYKTEILH